MGNYYQKEIETASREEILRIQNEKIVRQVKHVYESVPYYRDLMDQKGVKPEDIKSVDDIKVQSEIVEQIKSSGRDEPIIAHYGCIPSLSLLRASGVNGVSLDNGTTSAAELKDLIHKLELLAEERLSTL